jgi:hypothetical protein
LPGKAFFTPLHYGQLFIRKLYDATALSAAGTPLLFRKRQEKKEEEKGEKML